MVTLCSAMAAARARRPTPGGRRGPAGEQRRERVAAGTGVVGGPGEEVDVVGDEPQSSARPCWACEHATVVEAGVHDALGPARRARRVEEVGGRAEPGRLAGFVGGDGLLVLVTDPQHPRRRHVGDGGVDVGAQVGMRHQDPGAGVGEDPRQLVLLEVPVDREEPGLGPTRGRGHFDELEGVRDHDGDGSLAAGLGVEPEGVEGRREPPAAFDAARRRCAVAPVAASISAVVEGSWANMPSTRES